MENNNEWLRKLGKDDAVWPKGSHDCNPSIINFEYDVLRSMAEKGNLYGTMLQIKDVFELLMKIPCVMGMIIMTENAEETSDKYQEVMNLALRSPMAMGDWNRMASLLIKQKDNFKLPASLVTVLKKTRSLFNEELEPDGKNIMAWRNETIGHGALRFEDDPSLDPEITGILTLLQEYFGSSLGRLYENLYIESEGVRLIGDQISFVKEADICLYAEGNVYPISDFIMVQDLTCFFFNAYYIRKKKAQFSSFMGGRAFLESNDYFEALIARMDRLRMDGLSFKQKKTTRGDEALLEMLNDPDQYCRPEGLITKLKNQMDTLKKGVIMIQMERGTGKSAFANQMSGLHHSKTLIKGSHSRIYHLANASLRGIRDFSTSLEFSFRNSYNSSEDLYSTDEEIRSFNLNDENPSKSLAAFLNAYQYTYEKDFTILVLDGIDEMTSESRKILECIPERDQLDDGVFILLLSRFEDEPTVLSQSRMIIQEARSRSDALIELRRNDPININVLEQFIKNKLPSCEDPASLIEKADYRFLYLKPYVLIKDSIILNNENETSFYKSFIDHLFTLYGEAGQNQIRELLSVFTLFPGITLEEIMKYLNMPSLTYTIVGILNDLMPVLSVTRDPDGNQYMHADEAYDRYVLNEFQNAVKDTCKIFDDSLWENLDDYLSQRSPSYEMIVYNQAVSKASYFAKEPLGFFGRYLLSLVHKSDEEHVLYSPETLLTLAAVIGHDELAKSGYRRVISNDVCDEIIRVIREGLRKEKAGETYSHPLYSLVRKQSPSFLSYLKGSLNSAPSFDALYEQYTEMMGKDALTEAFFWILDEDPVRAETIDLIEAKADVNAFIRYLFSAGKIFCNLEKLPDQKQLDEESMRLLREEGYYKEKSEFVYPIKTISPAEMRKTIQKAIDELNDPETDFAKISSAHGYDPIDDVYSNLEKYQEHEELSEALKKLDQAFYGRLCREAYPKYLFNLLDISDQNSVLSNILNAMDPEHATDMLVKWAGIFYEKADPNDYDPSVISSEMLLQAAAEYRKKGDIENMLKCLEIRSFEYAPIRYFGVKRWKEISEDLRKELPEESISLLWYTDELQNLIENYECFGKIEQIDELVHHLNIVMPLIVQYTEEKSWNMHQARKDCFSYIRFLKDLKFPDIDETWTEHIREKQLAKIRCFLDQAGKQSEYGELSVLCEEYFSYDVRMKDTAALQDHTEQIISMIRFAEEKADPTTRRILANEIERIRRISAKCMMAMYQ